MTDDLEARLRAADPVTSTDPDEWSPSRLAELMEETMNDQSATPKRIWAVPAAAAVILALAVGGVAVAHNLGDDSGSTPAAVTAPMKLRLPAPAGGLGNSCIVFSVDILADMPVAFSGTVAEVADSSVLLDVDHWYRGGSADQVQLGFSDASSIALDGAVTFTAGQRYLVTASDKVVSGCGYTSEWNADMAASFDQAFG